MSNSAATTKFANLVELFPLLHCWDGEFSHGGFDQWMLRALFKFLDDAGLTEPGKRYLETGAGLSTLVFLCTAPASVTTVCLEQQDFFDRLQKAMRELSLPEQALEVEAGYSEIILPKLVLDKEPFSDFSFIDGGHGWPTVFVDFFYATYATKQYGYVAIDDTQLYSVQQLVALLSEQPGWKKVEDLGKLVIFQKLYAQRMLPDFGGQPFIKSKSGL